MKIKKYYHIYKIINLINHKIYIGRHYGNIEDKYSGSGLLLNKAYKKYGKNNFKKELIEINNNLLENKNREKFWIKELNSFQPNGYNINEGGDGGDNLTNNPNYDKICKKISKSIIKKHILNPETNKIQGEKIKGSNNGRWKGGICKINKEKSRNKKLNKQNLDNHNKILLLKMWNDRNFSTGHIMKLLNVGHSRFHRYILELNLSKRKYPYYTLERRLKISKRTSGKNNPMYKDGRYIKKCNLSHEIINK
jgi:hypothetical protein